MIEVTMNFDELSQSSAIKNLEAVVSSKVKASSDLSASIKDAINLLTKQKRE
jgi:hypothetical protein